MPHEAGHTQQTTQIPAVQLPVGVVPNPQAGTSQDVLDLVKQSVRDPRLATGAQINPVFPCKTHSARPPTFVVITGLL